MTRQAEYLRISLALRDLTELKEDTNEWWITKKVQRAIEYLEERKIKVSPTGTKRDRKDVR